MAQKLRQFVREIEEDGAKRVKIKQAQKIQYVADSY
jgi:hypothetical protein